MPSAPEPVLPSRLDDRASTFSTRRFALPLHAAMQRIRAAIDDWHCERPAIRSVVRDHATIEMDVSRWTTMSVRIEVVEGDDGASTAVCAAITVRATFMGLAVGVALVNSLLGVPLALFLRNRERERAWRLGSELVTAVFSALEISG